MQSNSVTALALQCVLQLGLIKDQHWGIGLASNARVVTAPVT
jgi:hypothetical protein